VIKRVVNGVRIIAIMREVATSTRQARIREGATLICRESGFGSGSRKANMNHKKEKKIMFHVAK
jgi:hypothetical protein